MARQYKQEELFYEPDETNDGAISGPHYENENESAEWKTHPEEGQICHGKFDRRELGPTSVFVFQQNLRKDVADVKRKVGGGVL